MSDRLMLAHAIEDAGIERAKAERMASAIFVAIHDNVATKTDVAAIGTALAATQVESKADLAAVRTDLRAELADTKAELKADIAAVRAELVDTKAELKADIAAGRAELTATKAELKSDTAAVRSDLALVEHRLLTRLGGLMVVLWAALLAALHYWPPGHG